MKRHSFISSSSPRCYLAAIAGILILLAGGSIALTVVGYSNRWIGTGALNLYVYQMEKLTTARKVDIAFVGDSALGHTIDADFFSLLSGRRSINLALILQYGYGGSYNMIRHTLERHRPRVVVIMHSIDALSSRPSPMGFHLTSTRWDLVETSPLDLLKIYLAPHALRGMWNCVWEACWNVSEELPIVDDYPPQGQPGSRMPSREEIERKPLLPSDIEPDQVRFLERIAQLCDEQEIRCLYAHGPTFDSYCHFARDYLNRASAAIRAAGLAVVENTPICVPRANLGDAQDHVKPALKQVYTQYYYALLAAHLRGGPEASSPADAECASLTRNGKIGLLVSADELSECR